KSCCLWISLEVSDHQEIFLPFSVVCHKIVLLFQIRNHIAIYEGFFVSRIFSKGDQLFIERENRIRIFFLSCYVDGGIVWIYHKPWSSLCKSCVFITVPLNRSPGVVPAVNGDYFQRFFRSKTCI